MKMIILKLKPLITKLIFTINLKPEALIFQSQFNSFGHPHTILMQNN